MRGLPHRRHAPAPARARTAHRHVPEGQDRRRHGRGHVRQRFRLLRVPQPVRRPRAALREIRRDRKVRGGRRRPARRRRRARPEPKRPLHVAHAEARGVEERGHADVRQARPGPRRGRKGRGRERPLPAVRHAPPGWLRPARHVDEQHPRGRRHGDRGRSDGAHGVADARRDRRRRVRPPRRHRLPSREPRGHAMSRDPRFVTSRRSFLKLAGASAAALASPLATKEHLAYAQTAAPATYLIEINLRDQLDFMHVMVPPGLAKNAALKRGDAGRQAALFYRSEELIALPNNVFLTPQSAILRDHADTIAAIELCDLTKGNVHGHEASNCVRSPGRERLEKGQTSPGKLPMWLGEPGQDE
ncbi:twin-arginine translocation signal domain-containing protein, partial [bacterium]